MQKDRKHLLSLKAFSVKRTSTAVTYEVNKFHLIYRFSSAFASVKSAIRMYVCM